MYNTFLTISWSRKIKRRKNNNDKDRKMLMILSLAHCWRKPLEIRFFFFAFYSRITFFLLLHSYELSISSVSVLFSLLLYFITIFCSLLLIMCVYLIFFFLFVLGRHHHNFVCLFFHNIRGLVFFLLSFIRYYFGWWLYSKQSTHEHIYININNSNTWQPNTS